MEKQTPKCWISDHIFGDGTKDPSLLTTALCPHRDCIQPREPFFSKMLYRCLHPRAQEGDVPLSVFCRASSITTALELNDFLIEAEQQMELVARRFIVKNYPTVNEEEIMAAVAQLQNRPDQRKVIESEIAALYSFAEHKGMGRPENTSTYLPNRLEIIRRLKSHLPQPMKQLDILTELDILYTAGATEAGNFHSLLYSPRGLEEKDQHQQAKDAYSEWLDKQFKILEFMNKIELLRKNINVPFPK